VLSYDARSVSRVYEMSFSEGVWKMWREAPGFWQRYESTVSKNGKILLAIGRNLLMAPSGSTTSMSPILG